MSFGVFCEKTKRRKSRPRRKSRRHHRPCQAALSIVVAVTSTITGYRPPATHHPPTYHLLHTTHHLHTTHLLIPEHTTVCACRLPNTPGHLPQCSCCALGCSSSRSAPIQRPRLQPPLQHRRRRRRAAAPIAAPRAAPAASSGRDATGGEGLGQEVLGNFFQDLF